ncbi:hypothetical protein HDV06_007047 [Boothiomyces sp. JEL0866]|nr:hypothetical protein HDV06_007047 [Boothiomyces sp. JEL0866]
MEYTIEKKRNKNPNLRLILTQEKKLMEENQRYFKKVEEAALKSVYDRTKMNVDWLRHQQLSQNISANHRKISKM